MRMFVETVQGLRHHAETAVPNGGGVSYAAGHRMPLHGHVRGSVSLVVAGDLVDESEGRAAHCVPLTVIVKPGGMLHATEVGSGGARTIALDVEGAGTRVVAEGCRWLEGGPAVRAFFAVWGGGRGQGRCDGVRADHDGQDAVRAAFEALLSASGAMMPQAALEPDLARARAWLGEGLATAEVAARLGVHRATLSRRLGAAVGCPPRVLRAQRRLARAASALAMGQMPLAQVAAECGYADQAHMTRALRAATGVTPARYRRLVRGAFGELAR